MHNPFFENIQIALSRLTAATNSVLSTDTNSSVPTGIQQLKKEQYSAVAGGPQVENDPQA